MEVQEVGGVSACGTGCVWVFVYYVRVCVCLLSTLVTSGVIFLASRRDSEIIRNVNTHWSLYSYEFSVSFSLSLSFAVAFINTHTHTHSLRIILSPLVQACVMNDTCKAWHDLAMWQWKDICGNNALSPTLCLCLWREMHFNFLLCLFLHWVIMNLVNLNFEWILMVFWSCVKMMIDDVIIFFKTNSDVALIAFGVELITL